MKEFDVQPTLEKEIIRIRPLKHNDFETLYTIASDPLIWEQHPNRDRYKREVFEVFFEGAMESGGAFLVIDNQTNMPIGSTRYYGIDTNDSAITIGYTFLAKDHWGGKYNKALKTLMINNAFTCFNKVMLHIGACNIRSQKSIERLGARKIDEIEIAYYGEPGKLNFIYQIDKDRWEKETIDLK